MRIGKLRTTGLIGESIFDDVRRVYPDVVSPGVIADLDMVRGAHVHIGFSISIAKKGDEFRAAGAPDFGFWGGNHWPSVPKDLEVGR